MEFCDSGSGWKAKFGLRVAPSISVSAKFTCDWIGFHLKNCSNK